MTGEPMHTASKERNGTVCPSYINYRLKSEIRFVVSYIQPVTQHYESRTVQKAPLQSTHTKNDKWCRTPQLYQLSSEK